MKRTTQVNRGLLAMNEIVNNIRQSVGAADDPVEEEAIRAAMQWIHMSANTRAKKGQ